MTSVAEISAGLQKKFGKTVIAKGVGMLNVTRIPTGWFPVDYHTGGGFPKGRISILYGAESSLKTTLALKAIAMHQKMFPKEICVFVDLENHYDALWGKILGVDNSKLVYILPDYAEQAVDIIDGLMKAGDLGMVVVDSLAAMITTNESTSSADKAVVGGSGLVIGKLYRKLTLGLSKARREGRFPAVIIINQVRMKVGVVFGDPETMPGGNAFKFASSLTLRVYGKDVMLEKANATMPSYKNCSVIIKKYKVPIIAKTFEFKMGALNNKEHGVKLGHVDDWPHLWSILQEIEWVTKRGKKIEFFDEIYDSIPELKKHIMGNTAYVTQLKNAILKAVLERNAKELEDEIEEEDDDDNISAEDDEFEEDDEAIEEAEELEPNDDNE